MKRFIIFISIASLLAACNGKKTEQPAGTSDPLAIKFSIRSSWRHDTEAFTQGLVIHNGKLFESTGQKKSWIGIIDVKTGTPDKKVILEDKYFGEGITILNNKVYQLTWQHRIGFVYDLATFKKVNEFKYDTEGWGLTHDSTHLIMSDGTDKLRFLDTVTLKPVRIVKVTDEKGNSVSKLNELEYVEGHIFANQWQTNKIVKIDPQTGKVVGRLDLSSLARDAASQNPKADVLNGIAYHPNTKLFLVTGKQWPSIYILQLIN